jgi:hypothetical protein
MPDVGYKKIETLQYTEVVYYNNDGNEVARERNYDDTLWDESGPHDLTDQEREDYLPKE